MESARNLPEETDILVSKLRSGVCPMAGDLLLEPVGDPTIGFGVVIDRIETPLSPHQVRTKTDLAHYYAREIKKIRAAFITLGFRRAAQLYVTTEVICP
jgi:hypothetical protein